MNALPPKFVENDPQSIESDLIARYEAKTGKTLYPAQIERLFINQIAYAHSMKLSAIQGAAEKMLVRFSSGSILDYLGDLVGTPRLPAAAATCRIRLTLQGEHDVPVPVPVSAGTPISTGADDVVFLLDADALVGYEPVFVGATAAVVGERGNGWQPGQISTLETSLPVNAVNATVSEGGAEVEGDDRYRERIILAPEAYTTAGSYGAYRFHALGAHQSIVDVAVHGAHEGQPAGHIGLYPLVEDGLPSDLILSLVQEAVSDDRRRPLSDTVRAMPPSLVEYSIRATVVLYDTAPRTETMLRVRAALDAYLDERRLQLGADLVPEQIGAVLHVAGVYRVQVHEPALQVLASNEWARCTHIDLIDGGAAHG